MVRVMLVIAGSQIGFGMHLVWFSSRSRRMMDKDAGNRLLRMKTQTGMKIQKLPALANLR